MKKILFLSGLLLSFLSFPSYSIDVWQSSTTATNDGLYQKLCNGRSVLHGICTDFGVAAASTTIVNSSFTFTATGATGPVSTLAADQCKYYDSFFSAGLGYQKLNTAAITILYSCYKN